MTLANLMITLRHKVQLNEHIRLTNKLRYNKLILLVVDRIRAVPVVSEQGAFSRMKVQKLSRVASQLSDISEIKSG